MKHISIKQLTGLSLAALTLTASALAETSDSALVKGGRLNLRQEPSLSAKVLGQFPTGTLVEIVEAGADWHKVEVNGKEGYMMAKFLNNGVHEQTAIVRTNTGIGLNLREEPHTEGAIITSAKNGAEVVVLQKGADWCRVLVGGEEGFMSTQYLKFSGQSSSLNGRVAVVTNPKDTQVLNLRQAASLDAKVIDYYRNGVKVTILQSGKTWHKVQVEDGKIGYMMNKFLRLTDEEMILKPFQAKVININGGSYVNLREKGSLSARIIDRIDVKSTVTVIEHGTDWCKVIADGVEGYMSTWFLAW